MGLRNPHAIIDKINAAQDRLIARKLRRNPRALGIARRNLTRWMAASLVSSSLFYGMASPLELSRCERNRGIFMQRHPYGAKTVAIKSFRGVLSNAELKRIRQKHEKART